MADTQALAKGQATLSLVMNEMGGIKDDCIITKIEEDHFMVVFNAGCKDKDMHHVRVHHNRRQFPDMRVEQWTEATRSLIAVQGPQAQHLMETVLDDAPKLNNLGFMETTNQLIFDHSDIIVSRCGYTGEDGFEVSLPNHSVVAFMDRLLEEKGADGKALAVPVGLGARDSLRLEAGLSLYGHELLEDISPIKAMLSWTISKRRKEELGFLGDFMIKNHIDNGVNRKRCGFIGEGKVPIRDEA